MARNAKANESRNWLSSFKSEEKEINDQRVKQSVAGKQRIVNVIWKKIDQNIENLAKEKRS